MTAGLRGTTLFADANLKAYYEFETGAVATDTQGTYNLTNNGSISDTLGKFGQAANLGTTNTTKWFGKNSSNWGIGTGNAWSISLWTRLGTEITTGRFTLWQFRQGSSGLINDLIYEYNGGTITLYFRRSRFGVATDQVSKVISLGTSTIHHIVCTYDGSTLRLYVDNAAAVTASASGTGSAISDELSISSDNQGSFSNGWNGIIDDFAVFNKTLSSGEVSTLFNAPVGGDGMFPVIFI